ncbi:MAG: endopeptidase La [Acidobacteriota bacterium]|nr:endopeptidase La [Acidobacteriota bacterium]MDE2711617.1 endopeptidase La [Acidobacteriota bacterium]MXW70157.1 endopeptidase La [Acidobacteriota bacterium]MXX87130.1 endopeptidase La [Acidobacteriota bacterium]MYE44035.1 endopeptidase La [Acidobacteriota bacterium]
MSDPVKGAPTESGSPQGQVHRMVPVLPLRDIVVFPHSFLPLSVGRKSTIQMLRDATREAAEADPSGTGKVMLAVLTQKDDSVDHPGEDDLYRVGTAARLEKQVRMREGTVRIVIRGSFRFRVERIVQTEPYVRADIRVLDGTVGANKTVEFEALTRKIREELQEMIKTDLFPRAREVMKTQLARVGSAGQLADFVAEQLPSLNTEMRQEILQTLSIEDRLGLAYAAILREKQVRDLGRSIESKVKSEVGRTQREFFLREQMKAIQKELGEGDDSTKEMDELREKIEKAGMPEEAEKEALREFRRLGRIPPASAEYTVGRTYLDWLVRVPWDKRTEDKYDIPRAKDILEADHYDLEKVKDRILEFLAVRERKPDQKGPILCFAGPPGVGKTSLGRSIAKAVGREFVRLSLGGIRDEAEIRGHRRTYIGALPGQIIQGLVRAGTRNPVFMLDEVDKLGMDFRGDPSSALLEVLDPEQNDTFRDHYLDLAFDLSDVLFIATANMMDPVPPALKDRMEILHLQGYTEEEKIQIATRHLIPRQLENHGLDDAEDQPLFEREALALIIRDYTREAGLRNMERSIAKICRKAVRKLAEGEEGPLQVTPDVVSELLGAPTSLSRELVERVSVPGVAVGLAWTPVGGDLLFAEASRMKGNTRLTLTGQLGDVMKESATAALSWVREHGAAYGIQTGFYRKSDIHFHVPEGSTPKDGPSAGITLVAALISVLTETVCRPELAMTGEITLTGHVLPVGGIKEKLLAAHRYGIKEVILPRLNEGTLLEDVPDEIRDALQIHLVSSLEETIPIIFPDLGPAPTIGAGPEPDRLPMH